MEKIIMFGKFTCRQSVLNAALNGFDEYGFSLTEPDKITTELRFKGEIVRIFPQETVTFNDIHNACREYLSKVALWPEKKNITNVTPKNLINYEIRCWNPSDKDETVKTITTDNLIFGDDHLKVRWMLYLGNRIVVSVDKPFRIIDGRFVEAVK